MHCRSGDLMRASSECRARSRLRSLLLAPVCARACERKARRCSVVVGQRGGWRAAALLERAAWGRSGASVDTAVCARLLPRTSTSLPLRHLGPGPASVIRVSPDSQRFRILNVRRKMRLGARQTCDASLLFLSRCLLSLFSSSLSLSLSLSSLSSSSSSLLLLPLFIFFFLLSSLLWMKETLDDQTLSHRHLPSRVHSPLAKYVRIFARVARRKYHSSAIPIGTRSIAIDFFVGLRRAQLFSCLRVSSILPCFTR